jgi:NAD(P)-dependent dehydrogenase (short-subunit alcohol dehydrogenase family)
VDAGERMSSVLVLGGGSELGLAIARALAPDVAVLAGRSPERLADREVAGARVEAVAFDGDDTEAHEAALDQAWIAAGGTVDVVVVAFGAIGAQWPGVEDPGASVALLRTNALGAGSAVLRAAARLHGQGSGVLVLLSSVAAERPRPSNYVYAAGKAAADFLARGVAEATGVRVLVVRPGFVPTAMTEGMKAPPLSATPEQVAHATVEALRRGRRVVYVPRSMRAIAMISRLLPAAVVKRLPR